jgi:hypothetical protein
MAGAATVVPLRARLTALAGALILSPDTMLLRLAKVSARELCAHRSPGTPNIYRSSRGLFKK